MTMTFLSTGCGESVAPVLAPAAQQPNKPPTKRPRQETSDVYQFITELSASETSNKKKQWRCNLCFTIKKKVKVWNTKNTSTFRVHLEKVHPGEYCRDTRQSKIPSSCKQFSSRYITDYSHHSCVGGGNRSKTTLGRTMNAAERSAADTKLINWIAHHPQPFSVVEQQDFVEYSAALNSSYKVPCRQRVRAQCLKSHQEAKARLKLKLNDFKTRRIFGVTTDMWTSVAKRGMHYAYRRAALICSLRFLVDYRIHCCHSPFC